MRFFSNDAKETTETDSERADDSSTVPQQRSGSPWSDAPVTEDHEGHDHEGHDHDAHDHGGPETETDSHDTDVDLPLDGRDASSDTVSETPSDTISDTAPDTVSDTSVGTYEDGHVNESTVTSPDAPVYEPTDAEVAGSDEDPALRDEGTFDEPLAVDPETEQPLDSTTVDAGSESESDSDFESDKLDEPGQAEVVDSDDESTTYASASAADSTDHDALAEDPTPADTSDTAPVVAAVPVAVAVPAAATADGTETESPVDDAPAKPGAIEEKKAESLFGADDAAAFKDRWRDVQLRFVDSPKDAAAEAAGLVEEKK